MNEKHQEQTSNGINEKHFSAESLLAEVGALLPDFFVARKIVMGTNQIQLSFYNGQNFCLTLIKH